MQMLTHDCRLFYKLHPALMLYANRKLRVIPDQPDDPEEYAALAPEKRAQVRDALQSRPDLIDQFVADNPFSFDADELDVIRSWRHAVAGEFYIFRHLSKYTVFLSSGGSPNRAYGVLALADSLEEVIGLRLPRLIRTVLLPFKGRIVYDGLLSGHNITFGGGIKMILNEEYKQAQKAFGIITSLPIDDEYKQAEPTFPLNLTHSQRKVIAEVLPALVGWLKIDEAASRTIRFTLDELREIAANCRTAIPKVTSGMVRNSLRHVVDAVTNALERFEEGNIARIPISKRLYQFKITLKDIEPPIWRRIQIKDCMLDKFHERIQTAMGWTNSHLHQFKIGGVLHGDPELLCEGFLDDPEVVNSLETKVSEIVPQNGERFRFEYEYDFGDGWEHEILFEGCLLAEKGARYPLCVEGDRACPPEDVGGIRSYREYLEALADPKHEQHEEFMEWRGRFDPEKFDAGAVTKRMRRGLPNWREME